MSGKGNVSRKSSTPERSPVCCAVLRKHRRGKRDQKDCGPKHHDSILSRIEIPFLDPKTRGKDTIHNAAEKLADRGIRDI